MAGLGRRAVVRPGRGGCTQRSQTTWAPFARLPPMSVGCFRSAFPRSRGPAQTFPFQGVSLGSVFAGSVGSNRRRQSRWAFLEDLRGAAEGRGPRSPGPAPTAHPLCFRPATKTFLDAVRRAVVRFALSGRASAWFYGEGAFLTHFRCRRLFGSGPFAVGGGKGGGGDRGGGRPPLPGRGCGTPGQRKQKWSHAGLNRGPYGY